MANFVKASSDEVHITKDINNEATELSSSLETISEVWESAINSHSQDFENLPSRNYDTMKAPRASSSVIAGFVEVNIYDAAPSSRRVLTLSVPRSTDISSLKREIFIQTTTSNISRDLDGNIEIGNEFCDYEFFLQQIDGIVLDGSTLLGDLLSDDTTQQQQLNVIDLKYSPHGGILSSIRTLIPGAVEIEEKQKLLQLLDGLFSTWNNTTTYDMIILSVGACTPAQIIPKFAQEASLSGKSVCIIAVNPGFYHCVCSVSDKLYGYQRSSSQYSHPLLLANWFEDPNTKSSADINSFHDFNNWQRVGERGDKFHHGDFLLKDILNVPGALQLHCFAMCWPGVYRNRALDSDILSSISCLIKRCTHNNCYFIPIFTTGLNDNDFHAEQFNSWMAQEALITKFIVPVIDTYQQQIRFVLCKHTDLAIYYWSKVKGCLPHNDIVARLGADFEPDHLAEQGGLLFPTLTDITFDHIAELWDN